MDGLMVVVAGGVLGGLLVVAVVMTYRLFRAGMRERGPLLMHRVLQHEGVKIERCTDDTVLAQVGAAARNCLLCRDQATCVAWLNGATDASLPQFCPNASLIARLRAATRATVGSCR